MLHRSYQRHYRCRKFLIQYLFFYLPYWHETEISQFSLQTPRRNHLLPLPTAQLFRPAQNLVDRKCYCPPVGAEHKCRAGQMDQKNQPDSLMCTRKY